MLVDVQDDDAPGRHADGEHRSVGREGRAYDVVSNARRGRNDLSRHLASANDVDTAQARLARVGDDAVADRCRRDRGPLAADEEVRSRHEEHAEYRDQGQPSGKGSLAPTALTRQTKGNRRRHRGGVTNGASVGGTVSKKLTQRVVEAGVIVVVHRRSSSRAWRRSSRPARMRERTVSTG